MFGDWEAAGSKDLATSAHEVVVDVLKNHEVTPIDADLVKDMKAVMDKADEAVRASM
jgi:trimethylamine--corrinoid protein Co-methyltransferase